MASLISLIHPSFGILITFKKYLDYFLPYIARNFSSQLMTKKIEKAEYDRAQTFIDTC
jgi:hypothetical protein